MRVLFAVLILACTSEPPPRNPTQRADDSAPAVAALREGKFDAASQSAGTALGLDPHNSRAAAVRAIASYVIAADELVDKLGKITDSAEALHYFDHEEGRKVWQTFLSRLDAIDADLAVAAQDKDFSLELCLACWEHDWNHNGRVDERDRRLFELEYDGHGGEIPDGDPRRRPTFRFDLGDVHWARAMLSFQRGLAELVLAYRLSELDKIFLGHGGVTDMRIKLVDRDRVRHARDRILAGVGFAEKCRQAYLAETDDDREWVPNPRQHGPMPLAVDDALYERWGAILGDVHRLMTSDEGLSLREMGALIDRQLGREMPDAYLDVGKMLDDPQDIVLDLRETKESPEAIEHVLRGLVGNGYQAHMRASPLVGRIRSMAAELDHGDETIEKKLRYLFWLN